MNTHITAHKAKVRHQWFFLILCFYSVHAGVPGPCKHSVTPGHLLNLRRLIKNQLQNGCLITYSFTERQNLSVVCYVKAVFPHILDLLNTQFRYAKDSDNYRYTNSLKNVIYNIYSQRCIPSINEEIENSPAKFVRIHVTLARAALEKAEEVIHMYMDLMTKSDAAINWNCEEEYTEDYPESTTETPGVTDCPCTCPAVSSGSSKTSMSTSKWNAHLKSTSLPQRFPFSSVQTLQNSHGRTKQLNKTEGAKPITHLLSNPASWTPALLNPMKEDGSASIPMDETPNSNLKMVHTSKELPDFLSGRTDFTLQSTVPGPYQKNTGDNIQNSVERSTSILLAKRSLDPRGQKRSSNSHSKLLQSRLTTTPDPAVDLKTAERGITPALRDNPVQMNKHMVPVTSTGRHLSEHLTTLDQQPGQLNSPSEYWKIHTQTLVRESNNFMQTISETKHNKDSGDKQKIKSHTTEDHQDRGTQRNPPMTENSPIISFGSGLLIIFVCGGLLLITLIFYRQQKVSHHRCICEINQNIVPSVLSQTEQG